MLVYWVILLAVAFLVLNAVVALVYRRQKDMRFGLNKHIAWRQRVEVASRLLDTDLRVLFIQGHQQHMMYEGVFAGIFKAFDLYGRRLQDGREETRQ